MKHVKLLTKLALAFVISAFIVSCGGGKKEETADAKPQDNELKSFMLGGIYFIKGYGGMDTVASMLSSAGMSTDSELIDGYKEIMEFPFKPEQASDIKPVLSQMWDINNKEELTKTLEELKTKEDKYKAWDYARGVNNACMGYAAGFLTEDEVTEYVTSLLPLAQEKYNNWEDYYKDFDLGRKNWNADDPESAAFEAEAKNILSNPKSIYKILPLK